MSDLIRREDAIELCAEAQGQASTKSELKGISKVWQGLLKLPSADRPEGQWEYCKHEGISDIWKCNQCGAWMFGKTNYCSNCGAYMKNEVI